MKRRDVLAQVDENADVDFVNENVEETPEGETKQGEEANLLKIVYAQIATLY